MKLCAGVDITEISRIKKSLENPRFLTRFFSVEEQALYALRRSDAAFAAGCFSAKEAFSKALGTGVRGFALWEVSVPRDKLGKPRLVLTGAARTLAEERGLSFDVSITHTKDHAVAFVVGYTEK